MFRLCLTFYEHQQLHLNKIINAATFKGEEGDAGVNNLFDYLFIHPFACLFTSLLVYIFSIDKDGL